MGSSPLSSGRLSSTRLASCVVLFLALAATAAAQAPAAWIDELLLSRSSIVVYGEVLSTSRASSGDRPATDSLLEVEDVLHLQVTGPNEETWTYTNPVGRTAPTSADTAAFPCGGEPEEEPPPDGPDIECEDQRTLALGHEAYFGGRGVVREWDGAPIRVDIVRNFPGFVTDADLQGLLEPVRRLADQIEARLGYRIIEVGGVIDVPTGAPAGWDRDFNRFFESWRVRERGQVIAFYMNDDNPQDWDGRGGSIMSAHACCGTTSYNKRALGAWWNDGDPCCQGNANGRDGAVLVHELFHLLSFKHSYDQLELTGVEMSRGGLDRPWVTGSRVFYATNGDVDNLACVFPEGG